MNYFILDKINFRIKPKQIQLLFSNEADIKYISLSTKKYIGIIKRKINECKDEWDNLKKITNEYEYIHTNVPKYKNAVSKIKPISRAFFKLIEIFNTFHILDNFKNTKIKTFHLAEGPGGFIEALSYLRFNKGDIYYGMTLIDNDNCKIPGWKKTEDFLKKNMNVVIEKGSDGTGNLYNPDNLRYIMNKYRNSMEVVTGDGGFDFSIDYNKQEKMALQLIYAQIIYAIVLQKKGGYFILKVFDTFTKASVDLLYLLSCFYDKVHIMKPNTSRAANSEKYIICSIFKYTDTSMFFNEFLSSLAMLNNINLDDTSINRFLNLNINFKYISTIREINTILSQQQMQNISRTLKLVENTDRKKEKYTTQFHKNIQKCINWCIKHQIPYNKFNQGNIFLNKTKSNSIVN
jgi:23S rRNA U2552 (ribose-2'-O)-methylase RlmE/FtsJ